jgi:hypothetical protein
MGGADRKMFAPLRRGEAVSPEAKVVAMLRAHGTGMTAATLADELGAAGLAIGTRASLRARVTELLDELEQGGRVERIPDGRYRPVRRS